ncbi:phospholipase D-like domain-containing protein [Oligoflexus tunisiensis]|uniref:phospholipase D-like domain-containing protein n=1 Tax=Oligoflexus tunisiensis TaxID=708132 RepID=UPI00114CA2EB|nr:phospholipase D family protein [Oligoflexus tunisiensis]
MLVSILLAILIAPFVLSGCAAHALGSRQEAPYSSTLPPPEHAPLVKEVLEKTRDYPKQSGFYPLIDGATALRARTALADTARRSIDIQYYIWRHDRTGRLILSRLLDAAERGVRVRILLDDIHKGEQRSLLKAMDRHPLVEIRLFNPASTGSDGLGMITRGLEMVLDYDRMTHRMHNKLYLVDGSFVIVGGRNIGDEYFDWNGQKNFRDLDVLAAGPAATRFSKVFDLYWNAAASVPVNDPGENLNHRDSPDWMALRKQFATAPEDQIVLTSLGPDKALPWLVSRLNRMIWAPFRILASSPDIVFDDEAETFGEQLLTLPEPQQELLVETAYFIPSRALLRRIREWRKKGVKIRILTNSMRSNDVLAAHAGYAKYRDTVLEAGAELYEWRSDNQPARSKTTRGVLASRANLHTKAYVIDREYSFVGSYNLDPRSSDLNTECGVLIRSRAFAESLAEMIEHGMQPTNSWKVSLRCEAQACDDDDLLWKGLRENAEVVFHEEPDSSFWQRLSVKLIGWLPIDEAL